MPTAVITPTSAFSTPVPSLPPAAVTGTPAIATPTLIPTNTPIPTATPTPTPTVVVNNRSIGDSYTPELGNTGYDVQRYTLQMALDPGQTHINSTALIETIITEDDLTDISLDFIGFQIQSLLLDGQAATFSRVDDKLIIDLPPTLTTDSPFTVAITYEGSPVAQPSRYVGFISSLGMRFTDNDALYVMSEPDGARYWFPNNDHPRDKATFRFELTVPTEMTAVANGYLVEQHAEPLIQLPGGKPGHTFIWEHNYPMATYLATVAVGEYERIETESPDGIPIRHYVFPELKEEFETAVSITGEAIDWMSELFGPYPFESFGFVTADVPGASLETQTMVLLSSQMVGQQTVIHELTHMWFGNWVSLDSWSEMWRNEGFATYVTLMWNNREDPEGLELEIEAIKSAVDGNSPQHPLGNPPPGLLFGFNTYFKGAVMIHELRREVGDEAFFAGLKTYFQRYGGGTASDAEFQAIMEEAAGKSLAAFFETWLN